MAETGGIFALASSLLCSYPPVMAQRSRLLIEFFYRSAALLTFTHSVITSSGQMDPIATAAVVMLTHCLLN